MAEDFVVQSERKSFIRGRQKKDTKKGFYSLGWARTTNLSITSVALNSRTR
jgi:hypothetical protein